MKSAKGYMHPKVGGLKQMSKGVLPKPFMAARNPYREARTAVTKSTGGKTKPMGKF
jgi:hypothetical protein